MAEKSYQAGVKDYRKTYWTPDYVPLDTDLLAVFKIVAQAGGRRRVLDRHLDDGVDGSPDRP